MNNYVNRHVLEKTSTDSRVSRTAWVVLSLNALFLFYKYILQISPSVITTQLMSSFHINALGLGNLAAMYFYSFLLVQLISGPLLDRYSPRKVTSVAILVAALGMGLFASAAQLWQAECARALIGVGVAFATVSYLKQTALWFPASRQGFVGSLLASAVGVGALVGQAPLAYAVQCLGWRHALFVCALIGVVVALFYAFFVKDRVLSAGDEQSMKSTMSWRSVKQLLSSRRNWLLTFYSGLAFSPLAVFAGLWGTPFLRHAHLLSNTQAAEYLTLAFVGLGLGAPVFGYLADRYGHRLRWMQSSTLLSLVMLLLVLYCPQSANVSLAGYLFAFGFGTGGFMLGFTLGKSMNPLGLAATVVAMINTGDALCGAVSEPLVGKLLDNGWGGKWQAGAHYFSLADFHHALLILPVYLVVALVLSECLVRGE